MSVIDAKRVAETAKEVSNEMVLAGKNPGVLLIDVCVEVARRLFGIEDGADGPAPMTRAQAQAKADQAIQAFHNLVMLAQQGQQLGIIPHVRDGREIVMLAATIKRTYRGSDGQERQDFVAHCEMLDASDPVALQNRYRVYQPLA